MSQQQTAAATLNKDDLIVIAGAGGFIAGALTRYFHDQGFTRIRAVDKKPLPEWYQRVPGVESLSLDLSYRDNCKRACEGAVQVYNLAADMGGMGFIEKYRVECLRSILINTHMIEAAYWAGVERYFFSSSACAYNTELQKDPHVRALKESDAYPAMAERGYGWEKLMSEMFCQEYWAERGLKTSIARFHNVYGPCFDAQTEVLTKDGWIPFPELGWAHEIATLNEETGLLEYHRPTAIQSYEYSGEMYCLKHRAGDLLVTPDHAIYYATRTVGSGNEDTWSRLRRGKVKDSKWDRARMQFSCHVQWEGQWNSDTYELPEVRYSDGRSMKNRNGASRTVLMEDWLCFVGWYLAEGSSWATSTNYTVTISQKPGDLRQQIGRLLDQLGFTWHTNGNDIVISSKQLYKAVQPFGKGAGGKKLPREYLMLPPRRLLVLFGTLMQGDGDADGGRYSTKSKSLADAVMELALKIGKRAWVGRDEGGVYRVHISNHTLLDTRRENRSVEHYDGRVYDVTVPNHVLMVRRNGKAIWSGNCGTWDGGREKAPAALSRKVIEAKDSGEYEITIWGDGTQTRSFMYIDDCVKGIDVIMHCDDLIATPINLGSSELVSINDLVGLIEEIAGVKLERRYDLDAPRGVAGRNSDNTFIKQVLDWEPDTPLREGMEKTYAWIEQQYADRKAGKRTPAGEH